jgi:hypothetical protein
VIQTETIPSFVEVMIRADGQMDRRLFLSSAVMAAFAAAFTGCAGNGVSAPDLTVPVTIRVSEYPELATINGVAVLTVQGSPLGVVRTGVTTFLGAVADLHTPAGGTHGHRDRFQVLAPRRALRPHRHVGRRP